MGDLDPKAVLEKGMDALREAEVVWLADSLAESIANLPYPVGCGNSPLPEATRLAAEKIFDRYAKIVELAAGRAALSSHNEGEGV